MDSLPNLILLIVGLLAIGQIAIAVYLHGTEKKFLERLTKALNLPGQERQSWSLWHGAMRKMQAILGQAELEGVKIVADSKYYTKELENVYKIELQKATAEMKLDFEKFLFDFEKEIQTKVEGKTDETLTVFTKKLEERLAQVEEQTLKFSFEEAKRAKEEVAVYKKTVVEGVQKDLRSIIEQVAGVVVGKSLTPTDQEDLIVEALERAKKEKFIS